MSPFESGQRIMARAIVQRINLGTTLLELYGAHRTQTEIDLFEGAIQAVAVSYVELRNRGLVARFKDPKVDAEMHAPSDLFFARLNISNANNDPKLIQSVERMMRAIVGFKGKIDCIFPADRVMK
jgi:hypothetical protein